MKSDCSFSDTTLVILSSKPWNAGLHIRLSNRLGCDVILINDMADFTVDNLSLLQPTWIFVPHWSYIIPDTIWSRWPTVIFHMTDLPYGRGGSPLQNLISHKLSSTFITALDCSDGIDSGDVYFKEPLSLHGSAEEIFIRADSIIESMIVRFLDESPIPTPQSGKPYYFKRRKPSDSNLVNCPHGDLSSWYDQIRMLDACDYPSAYLDALGMRLQFTRVTQRTDGLYADVRIFPFENIDPI